MVLLVSMERETSKPASGCGRREAAEEEYSRASKSVAPRATSCGKQGMDMDSTSRDFSSAADARRYVTPSKSAIVILILSSVSLWGEERGEGGRLSERSTQSMYTTTPYSHLLPFACLLDA